MPNSSAAPDVRALPSSRIKRLPLRRRRAIAGPALRFGWIALKTAALAGLAGACIFAAWQDGRMSGMAQIGGELYADTATAERSFASAEACGSHVTATLERLGSTAELDWRRPRDRVFYVSGPERSIFVIRCFEIGAASFIPFISGAGESQDRISRTTALLYRGLSGA